MTEPGSPLKLDPSTSKRRKLSLILEKCVICQKSGRETVVSFTDHSKSRFFDAATSNSNKQLLKVKRTKTHQQIQKKSINS
jgi:hypothetical protein